MSKNAAMVARDHLLYCGWESVGYGDAGLLHEIADKLAMKHEGPYTESKVLDRIGRSYKGVLEKGYTSFPERGLGRARRFYLIAKPLAAGKAEG